MLGDIKIALRIGAALGAFDTELLNLILAARRDLALSGVAPVMANSDTDPLIRRAIIIYCKANFGSDPDADRYQRSYDALKTSLTLAGDYNV